jgi:hypothetical protein
MCRRIKFIVTVISPDVSGAEDARYEKLHLVTLVLNKSRVFLVISPRWAPPRLSYGMPHTLKLGLKVLPFDCSNPRTMWPFFPMILHIMGTASQQVRSSSPSVSQCTMFGGQFDPPQVPAFATRGHRAGKRDTYLAKHVKSNWWLS